MARDLTLSEEVEIFIRSMDLDGSGMTAEEFSELQEHRAEIGVVVDDIVKSRETIIPSEGEVLEQALMSHSYLVETLLNDRFTRDLVGQVPGYVERTLQLSRLKAAQPPSKVTNGYLQEAVRTYIFGLPQASVALSRAALEQALKEGLGYQSSNTFVEMKDLLKEAETAGVIDHAHRTFARQVANAADDVLHEKPTTLPKALDVLIKMRGILEFVYSRE